MENRDGFRTVHDRESLLHATASDWAWWNAPWVSFNPAAESWNSGKWRLMESPLFFLMKSGCLLGEDNEPLKFGQVYDYGDEKDAFEDCALIPDAGNPLLNTRTRRIENRLDEKRLEEILAAQLGSLMRSGPFDHFSAHFLKPGRKWRFGLFAALSLLGYSDETKKDGMAILRAMCESVAKGGIPFRPENIDTGPAQELAPKIIEAANSPDFPLIHAAYENVFLMGLLKWARRRGVVSTAMFGWVKAFDRTLWYALAQTGRRVAASEAAGCFGHFYAEKAMGRALSEPFVDIAIDGFEAEMRAEGWLPEKEKRESNHEWLKRECREAYEMMFPEFWEFLGKYPQAWKIIRKVHEEGGKR